MLEVSFRISWSPSAPDHPRVGGNFDCCLERENAPSGAGGSVVEGRGCASIVWGACDQGPGNEYGAEEGKGTGGVRGKTPGDCVYPVACRMVESHSDVGGRHDLAVAVSVCGAVREGEGNQSKVTDLLPLPREWGVKVGSLGEAGNGSSVDYQTVLGSKAGRGASTDAHTLVAEASAWAACGEQRRPGEGRGWRVGGGACCSGDGAPLSLAASLGAALPRAGSVAGAFWIYVNLLQTLRRKDGEGVSGEAVRGEGQGAGSGGDGEGVRVVSDEAGDQGSTSQREGKPWCCWAEREGYAAGKRSPT